MEFVPEHAHEGSGAAVLVPHQPSERAGLGIPTFGAIERVCRRRRRGPRATGVGLRHLGEDEPGAVGWRVHGRNGEEHDRRSSAGGQNDCVWTALHRQSRPTLPDPE